MKGELIALIFEGIILNATKKGIRGVRHVIDGAQTTSSAIKNGVKSGLNSHQNIANHIKDAPIRSAVAYGGGGLYAVDTATGASDAVAKAIDDTKKGISGYASNKEHEAHIALLKKHNDELTNGSWSNMDSGSLVRDSWGKVRKLFSEDS